MIKDRNIFYKYSIYSWFMSYIEEEKKIFQPLEILEKRPNPNPFEKIKVKFNNIDDNQIDDVEGISENRPNIGNLVKDKRKTNLIDREAVLLKIINQRNVIDESDKKDRTVQDNIDYLKLEEPENEEEKVVEKMLISDELKEKDEKVLKPVRTLVIKKNIESKQEIIENNDEKEAKEKEELNKVDLTKEILRTQKVSDRLPREREKILMKASAYYMNNRKMFIQKVNELFKPYKKELINANENMSCDTRNLTNDFDLLTHQKVVRDYLNLYTPYRGLLLYHGLGSGKTCTSIALAEGMKSNKKVIVMTPASLKMNFYSELKKCGDAVYKKNQYWEFISIDGKPDLILVLAKALSLSTIFIKEHGGAWLVNVNKESNYEMLSPEEQKRLDEQLNAMIEMKYSHYSYNGLTPKVMNKLKSEGFDNAVLIVDEAHNFVSRIVNQINNKRKGGMLELYDLIMKANNAKIVLLTGTPIINYPSEIGVLYNLLRGYITTWTIPIEWDKKDKMDVNKLLTIFDEGKLKTHDVVEYSNNKIQITRNPYGFINTKKRGVVKGTKKNIKIGGKNKTHKYGESKMDFNEEEITEEEKKMMLRNMENGGDDRTKSIHVGGNIFEKYNGVKLNDEGNLTNDQFEDKVMHLLKKNGIRIIKQIEVKNHTALPDNSKDFINSFVDVDTGNAKNINLFQRRILGLTSYFRSAQEELLPSYVETEEGDIYHLEKTAMTDYQFGVYEKIRKAEHDKEKKTKQFERMQRGKKEEMFNMSSSYRVFSRAACNFTFPEGIERPEPDMKEGKDADENTIDGEDKKDFNINIEDENLDTVVEEETNITENDKMNQKKRIEKAMNELNRNKENTNEKEFLSKSELITYSPKFAKILENVSNLDNEGLHLIYSHFRTLEGIGILRLILLANGFAEFKIKKTEGLWTVIENEEDKNKPKFVLYTGTETTEEREIIRNVYNSMWEYVPSSIVEKIKEKNDNNYLGEVIKIIMITASGAEGINLKNTRFVHIVEPYWHMVRVEQVVGRARRICSHEDLPLEMRNVKVYLYISTLSEKQKKDEKHIELLIRDTSKLDKNAPITTDETLYELASIKQKINNQILNSIKETAIDCSLYQSVNSKSDEKIVCYGYGKVESNDYSSYPSIDKDKLEKEGTDVGKVNWKGQVITMNGIDYIVNTSTNEVYDYNDYVTAKRLDQPLTGVPIVRRRF